VTNALRNGQGQRGAAGGIKVEDFVEKLKTELELLRCPSKKELAKTKVPCNGEADGTLVKFSGTVDAFGPGVLHPSIESAQVETVVVNHHVDCETNSVISTELQPQAFIHQQQHHQPNCHYVQLSPVHQSPKSDQQVSVHPSGIMEEQSGVINVPSFADQIHWPPLTHEPGPICNQQQYGINQPALFTFLNQGFQHEEKIPLISSRNLQSASILTHATVQISNNVEEINRSNQPFVEHANQVQPSVEQVNKSFKHQQQQQRTHQQLIHADPQPQYESSIHQAQQLLQTIYQQPQFQQSVDHQQLLQQYGYHQQAELQQSVCHQQQQQQQLEQSVCQQQQLQQSVSDREQQLQQSTGDLQQVQHPDCHQQHQPQQYVCNRQQLQESECNQLQQSACLQQQLQEACLQQQLHEGACHQQQLHEAACHQQQLQEAACHQQQLHEAACHQQQLQQAACHQEHLQQAACHEQELQRAGQQSQNLDSTVQQAEQLHESILNQQLQQESIEHAEKYQPYVSHAQESALQPQELLQTTGVDQQSMQQSLQQQQQNLQYILHYLSQQTIEPSQQMQITAVPEIHQLPLSAPYQLILQHFHPHGPSGLDSHQVLQVQSISVPKQPVVTQDLYLPLQPDLLSAWMQLQGQQPNVIGDSQLQGMLGNHLKLEEQQQLMLLLQQQEQLQKQELLRKQDEQLQVLEDQRKQKEQQEMQLLLEAEQQRQIKFLEQRQQELLKIKQEQEQELLKQQHQLLQKQFEQQQQHHMVQQLLVQHGQPDHGQQPAVKQQEKHMLFEQQNQYQEQNHYQEPSEHEQYRHELLVQQQEQHVQEQQQQMITQQQRIEQQDIAVQPQEVLHQQQHQHIQLDPQENLPQHMLWTEQATQQLSQLNVQQQKQYLLQQQQLEEQVPHATQQLAQLNVQQQLPVPSQHELIQHQLHKQMQQQQQLLLQQQMEQYDKQVQHLHAQHQQQLQHTYQQQLFQVQQEQMIPSDVQDQQRILQDIQRQWMQQLVHQQKIQQEMQRENQREVDALQQRQAALAKSQTDIVVNLHGQPHRSNRQEASIPAMYQHGTTAQRLAAALAELRQQPPSQIVQEEQAKPPEELEMARQTVKDNIQQQQPSMLPPLLTTERVVPKDHLVHAQSELCGANLEQSANYFINQSLMYENLVQHMNNSGFPTGNNVDQSQMAAHPEPCCTSVQSLSSCQQPHENIPSFVSKTVRSNHSHRIDNPAHPSNADAVDCPVMTSEDTHNPSRLGGLLLKQAQVFGLLPAVEGMLKAMQLGIDPASIAAIPLSTANFQPSQMFPIATTLPPSSVAGTIQNLPQSIVSTDFKNNFVSLPSNQPMTSTNQKSVATSVKSHYNSTTVVDSTSSSNVSSDAAIPPSSSRSRTSAIRMIATKSDSSDSADAEVCAISRGASLRSEELARIIGMSSSSSDSVVETGGETLSSCDTSREPVQSDCLTMSTGCDLLLRFMMANMKSEEVTQLLTDVVRTSNVSQVIAGNESTIPTENKKETPGSNLQKTRPSVGEVSMSSTCGALFSNGHRCSRLPTSEASAKINQFVSVSYCSLVCCSLIHFLFIFIVNPK